MHAACILDAAAPGGGGAGTARLKLLPGLGASLAGGGLAVFLVRRDRG